MPQIAQQDYIRIPIAGGPSELTQDERNYIYSLHDRGVLLDAVLDFSDGGNICRVIEDGIGNTDTISIVYNGTLTVIDVS